ncbi:helix-turn-helix domain-containing protein [Pygmaiobacter massiliensis]|uniref:helix-turn-helix domain-containing protein n=1 Tax=Pygmaiobacter massiliensis TaxID=1917873 RepID=UPI000C7AB608|nr:helix-turn-helix transcriptional regulator [Pygmaiobacter massiliensis]
MFFDNYCELCKIKGKSPTGAALEIGLSRSAVSAWRNTTRLPQAAQLQKIADYFGVTIDQLLDGEQKENHAAKSDEVTFDDFTYALHNQSKELNDANKEKLLDMARMLKLAQDAQKNK